MDYELNGRFTVELNYIEDENIRRFISRCLDMAPDYFFEMPASTTGKYHPAYTLGKGGLVRHVKAAVRIAAELLQIEQYNNLPKDEIIAALILHDVIKKGNANSRYTVVEHPILATNFISQCFGEEKDKMSHYVSSIGMLELTDSVTCICELIKSHMGQWNTDRSGRAIMPKPETEAEKFVHLCDYLASRKFITCEVE